MSYCHYHPLSPASHHCTHCDQDFCPTCLNESKTNKNPTCMICERETESLGVQSDVVPFWRRIDQSFRYPLSKQSLSFIVVVSMAMAAASFLFVPLMIGLYLLTSGVMFKYCFNCLSETAMGNMQAPNVTSAYEGGVLLVFKILFVLVLLLVAVATAGTLLGAGFASFLGFFVIVSIPAMIILYAMTESLAEALNPLKIIALISSIGMPYGLILALMMVMLGSVDLLSQIIGYEGSFVSMALQSAISNFYSVVMFHLMGYMIFQYQAKLGYTAESLTNEPKSIRSDKEKCLAHIKLLTKKGELTKVARLYEQALKSHPGDKELNESCFQLSLARVPKTPNQASLVFDRYLKHLTQSGQNDKLAISFKRASLACKHYLPTDPNLRFELARSNFDKGNFKLTVKLLKDLHKSSPHFIRLIDEYELLVKAILEVPELENKAPLVEEFLNKLKRRRAAENAKKSKPFESKELETPTQLSRQTKPAINQSKEETGLNKLPPIEFN
ncbi:hypothetical protein [Oleiphilus sp. HI0125]|uniref:hypothetical protein n=2 Tax=Oleiphilus sp. HI0125 TaxID=1822266 RepID=UPI000B1A9A70|nr:hypothetical protein [Oleiphilus sp. HI0125]